MGLDQPSDNIDEVLLNGANVHGKVLRIKDFENNMVNRPDLQAAARHMIAAFRSAKYGTICLDQDQIDKK